MTDIITNEDKLACASRELKYREYVYARRAAEGKMSEGKKEHELACMRAIVADYDAAVKAEKLI